MMTFISHVIAFALVLVLSAPQPLKYSVSTATHLAYIILLYNGLLEHCDSFGFTRIKSNDFPNSILRVHGTLFLLRGSLEATLPITTIIIIIVIFICSLKRFVPKKTVPKKKKKNLTN